MENRITTTNIGQFHARLVEDEKSEATIEKYLRDVEAFFLCGRGCCNQGDGDTV